MSGYIVPCGRPILALVSCPRPHFQNFGRVVQAGAFCCQALGGTLQPIAVVSHAQGSECTFCFRNGMSPRTQNQPRPAIKAWRGFLYADWLKVGTAAYTSTELITTASLFRLASLNCTSASK
jgi:hypothetical protein